VRRGREAAGSENERVREERRSAKWQA